MGERQRVVVWSATSAIATEVAVRHARRGDQLHLVGRDEGKLLAVVARCRDAGAQVSWAAADLDRLAEAERVVGEAWGALGGRFDRALLAQGLLGDQIETERSFEAAEALFRTNLLSVVALLVPLANRFEQQRTGRLGVITSVAGERGRPRNYTYGAAKGALNVYLQGLRTRLVPSQVSVTTLKLGPVDTPMTSGHPKHLLFGRTGPVADSIVAAMDAQLAEVFVPRVWAAIMPLVRLVPEAIFQRVPFLSGR